MTWNNSKKGQTLIAVLMVMAISLAVGLAISQRIIVGQKRSTYQDTSARALAVAEAAIEKVLTYSSSTLDDYITNNNCGANCQVSITGSDGIVASATVTLSYSGNVSSSLDIKVLKDTTYELDLTSYSSTAQLEICWDNATSGDNPSIVTMQAYGSTMPSTVAYYAYNSASTSYTSNGFSSATPDISYQNCFTLPARSSLKFARVRSIYNDANVHFVPKSGATLPIQGYLLSSTGSVNNIKKTIQVVKSKPFLPASFDFTIFSTSTDDTLTN